MGLFFYTKISSIISIGDLPTTNIIEPNNKDYLLQILRYSLKFCASCTELFYFFGHLAIEI
ncbi:hypothetical protein RK782_03900, partial [Streptococcus pneumoniae]|nr:hypothetical protein [Streptococcus pneumoniae]